MPALAGEVLHLVGLAPGLVRDIYCVAFDHQETSKEPTTMREGVLAMSSHRSQDYAHAHYGLAEAYPGFLTVAPAHALDALGKIWLNHVRRRRSSEQLDHAPIQVAWNGEAVEIQPDGSYLRERDDGHDYEVKLLAAFGQWLREAAAGGKQPVREAIAIVRSETRPTAVWRRVLRVAAEDPEPFTTLIEPLVTTPAVVASPELEDDAGPFLHAGFRFYSKAARRRIERAIVSIPATVSNPRIADPDRARHHAERSRDALLGCLDQALLVTAAARQQLSGLIAADAAEPVKSIETVVSRI